MESAKFVVGIDLGTTHCAIAAASLEDERLHLLAVPQLVAPGEVQEEEVLPSFLYLPAPGEFTDEERRLPWGPQEHLIGSYARKHGAKNPNRLVASAKSWVCHGGVNRRAAILPWSAPDQEPHVSPYEAQVAYLTHLRRCWAAKYPSALLHRQKVVVTVPASFDEGARSLTLDAAREAGLGEVRLIEEPQAAFYDYLGSISGSTEKDIRKRDQLSSARLILVVDVGGGTTDLTLLRVLPDDPEDASDQPTIERIAVGGHLMLGGDNMDGALAVFALSKAGLEQPSDATVWSGLVQSARNAKERLLSAGAPKEAIVSYQGRGARLVGNTKSIIITRDEATQVLLDGCFPRVGPSDIAQRTARAGLTTLGLPYTNDTAVPRHICSFLRRHALAAAEAGASVENGLPRPDLVLLNGGVFNAPAVAARLLEVLASWYPDSPPAILEHNSLTTSVATGAVRYGLALEGLGTFIEGGSAKAYYIGVQGGDRTLALCVAPRGAEEGTVYSVPSQLFQLRLNEPISFPLFVYTGDREDAPGTVLEPEADADALDPLAPLETLLRGQKGTGVRESTVSVSIESQIDSLGNLKLSLVSAELPPRRWKLDFALGTGARAGEASMRPLGDNSSTASTEAAIRSAGQKSSAGPLAAETPMPPHPRANEGAQIIATTFSKGDNTATSDLRRKLEDLMEPRGLWSVSTCRKLADGCLKVQERRIESEAHELAWLRLVSWTLRPGFGTKEDRDRLAQLWRLQADGPAFPTKTNWGEWWILWRRLAPGLGETQQATLFAQVEPWLWPKGHPPSGVPLQGPVEMMRMVASLERLPATAKEKAGTLFIERIKKLGSYWPLGRVGARVPFHGPLSSVVKPDTAEKWLVHLLELDWQKAEGAAFAATSLARLTGDPARDVSGGLRRDVVDRLTAVSANDTWVDMVLRTTELGQSDIKQVLGDSLPVGLKLDAGM